MECGNLGILHAEGPRKKSKTEAARIATVK